jgi:ketosteroid isomerase-like protein
MPKAIIRAILGVTLTLGLVSAAACTAKPEPEYAGLITEGILMGMNESDYAKFSEHFDSDMKTAIPESTVILPEVRGKIGDYVPGSKEFWKATTSDIYTTVFYKTRFTEETADVVVRVVFRELEEGVYVSGLWFDSPKLRQ